MEIYHKISDVKNTQNGKLFDLGLSHSFENLFHNDVIFNMSDKVRNDIKYCIFYTKGCCSMATRYKWEGSQGRNRRKIQ